MVKNSEYLRELPRLPLHLEDWDGPGAQQPIIFEEVFADQAAPVSPLRASSSAATLSLSSSSTVVKATTTTTSTTTTATSAVDGPSAALPTPPAPSPQASPNSSTPEATPATTTTSTKTTSTGQQSQSSSPSPGSPAATLAGRQSVPETLSRTSQEPLSKAVLNTMRKQHDSTSSSGSLGPTKKYNVHKGESRARHAEANAAGLKGFRKITEVPDGFGTTLLTELGVLSAYSAIALRTSFRVSSLLTVLMFLCLGAKKVF